MRLFEELFHTTLNSTFRVLIVVLAMGGLTGCTRDEGKPESGSAPIDSSVTQAPLAAITPVLNAYFPGWQLASLSTEARTSWSGYNRKSNEPAQVAGDFNQDGNDDYALEITYDEADNFTRALVVLMSQSQQGSQKGFQPYVIDSDSTQQAEFSTFLGIIKKGTNLPPGTGSAQTTLDRDAFTRSAPGTTESIYVFNGRDFDRLVSTGNPASTP